jgi:predicted  nucleic acid-binding Zn-ribbon protein
MSEIHRDRELEHLQSMLYTYKVENKSMDAENERLKQEIRRLLEENTKLRAALEKIVNVKPYYGAEADEMLNIARAALGGE